MHKVVLEWHVTPQICLLMLDRKIPLGNFKGYRIRGKIYLPIHFHLNSDIDTQSKTIAIESNEHFMGESVEFI
nr:MAG TPA_asm: hypothetical protein [Caudoviricetes sp.]